MKKLFLWMLLSSVVALTACDDDANNEPSVGATEVRVTCDLTIALPSAAAAEGKIAYEVLYPIGTVVATAEVKPVGEDDGSWLTPAWSTEGTLKTNSQGLPVYAATITYKAAANHGPARSAELVIDYAGITGCTLVIRQPAGEPEIAGGGYPGWPELPTRLEKPNDYYYATHVCPDFTTAKGVSVKGLRNYTVCYSAAFRSAVYAAYPLHESYKGQVKRTEAWAYDPIILEALQPYIIKNSYQPQTLGYSRGHLLASNDRTAEEGMNRQTFYVTNMMPQTQNGFNNGVWSTLEEKSWENVCADTLFVVTGASYAGSKVTCSDKNGNTITVPTHCYKAMIRSKAGNTNKPLYQLSADELQCVAFWFENRSYTGENMTPAKAMISIEELEQKTGLTFFGNVPAAPKGKYSASDWKL